jgi:beta-galactosidase
MPGYGYAVHGGAEGNYRAPDRAETSFFEGALAFAGKKQRIRVSDTRIAARLHEGKGAGTYLWIANPKAQAIPVKIEVNGKYAGISAVLGPEAVWKDGCLMVTVPERYVIIYELK